MIKHRLDRHVKSLCIKNLRSKRVKCCAQCPFQDDIEKEFPETRFLFQEKQACTSTKKEKGRVPGGKEDKKAHLNLFPPNWIPGSKRNYLGADRKPILPFSYVRVDFSAHTKYGKEKLRKSFPWKEGTMLLFICEVRYSDGHCLIYDFDKKEMTGVYHTNEFRMCKEDEC